MRRINAAGKQLIRIFEGSRNQAYQDSVGVWTIGVGHTGPEVKQGLYWTDVQIEAALDKDLETAESGVEAMTRGVTLTDNQFAALVSFAFNLGTGRLRNSTLLKKVLAKDWNAAYSEFLKWDRAGGKQLPGLTRRRQAEADLFRA